MRISDWSSDVCSSDLAEYQPVHVHRLGIERLSAREGKQALGQCRGSLSRRLRSLDESLNTLSPSLSQSALDDLQAAADPGKKIVEVMGTTPRQLSYGFHLLRLAKRLMRLRQFGGALEHTVFKCLVRFLSPPEEP